VVAKEAPVTRLEREGLEVARAVPEDITPMEPEETVVLLVTLLANLELLVTPELWVATLELVELEDQLTAVPYTQTALPGKLRSLTPRVTLSKETTFGLEQDTPADKVAAADLVASEDLAITELRVASEALETETEESEETEYPDQVPRLVASPLRALLVSSVEWEGQEVQGSVAEYTTPAI